MVGSAAAIETAPVFDYEEPIFPQVGHLLSLAAQSYMNDGTPDPLELDEKTTVPCNYFFQDSWYMLSNLEVQLYLTQGAGAINEYAAFSFCQELNASQS